MFSLNNFEVEQEIARERYQAVIRRWQVEKIIALNKKLQPKEHFMFQGMFTWLGYHLVNLGCHLQQRCQGEISSTC